MKLHHPSRGPSGVALVSTMIILAVLAVVAVAFMQSATTDRASSRSGTNYYKAQLAAEAGLAVAGTMLAGQTANDHFIVVANTNGQLFAGSGTNQPAGTFAYRPLLTFTNSVSDLVTTNTNANNTLFTSGIPSTNVTASTRFTNVLPGGLSVTSPPVAWVYMTNANGTTNARFAFWVEDLSGRLDLSVVGATNAADVSNALRLTGTNPAEIALWSIFNPGSATDPGNASATALVAARSNLPTAATARVIPNANVTVEMLADFAARLRHDTNEPDVSPFGFGYGNQGRPKFDLNTNISAAGVTSIADIINQNLPQFAQRAGGYTNSAGGGATNTNAYTSLSYLQTLAANIIDYADLDSNPTTDGTPLGTNRVRPVYRGIDAYPFVTELNKRYVWTTNAITNFNGQPGRGVFVETTDFIEVWNPSSQATQPGTLTFLAVHGQPVTFGFLSSSFAGPTWASNSAGAVTAGTTTNQLNVPALQPNGFQALACPTVTNFFFVPSTNSITGQLGVETAGSSFHVAWNGAFVDAALGGMLRNQGNLNLGTPINRSQLPSFIYRQSAAAFGDPSLGDPRATLYLSRILDANAYAQNSTFGGRNRRAGTVAATQPFYEVSPRTWPDSGHDSLPGNPAGSDTTLPTAVAPAAYSNVPPGRISNAGAYSNIAELGAIFDPIQWTESSLAAWQGKWTNLTAGASADNGYGGGNSLRIGRAEHPRFTNMGLRAAQLLDLFAAGPTNSAGMVLRQAAGRINLNTAGTNVLRALAAGVAHASDPSLQPGGTNFVPPVAALGVFVQGITNARGSKPFFSVNELPFISTNGVAAQWPTNSVFGNTNSAVNGVTEWSDAAAEQWFRMIHSLATVRSRNFLAHVVAQSVATNNPTTPLSTCRMAAQIYLSPQRSGGLTTNSKVEVIQTWGL
jgi:Tfp pilus assembly protein PilX